MKKFDKFFEGLELKAYELFGAHKKENGVEFTVFAPEAKQVEVYMSSNWANYIKLNKIDQRGIWQVFIDDIEPYYLYKYRFWINNRDYVEKSDPFAYTYEIAPKDSSIIYDLDYYHFTDDDYINKKEPLNIYELHINSFKKEEDSFYASYRDLKSTLVPYLKDNNFNCLNLMPIFEYKGDETLGIKSSAFFAPSSRFGTPYDFMDLINEMHQNNIKVILDVNYYDFAKNDNLMEKLDGGYLYESDDNLRFDYSKGYVCSFLLSSIELFINRYHIDGFKLLNVDKMTDKENTNGQKFLKLLVSSVKHFHPEVLLISDYQSDEMKNPVSHGGYGFDFLICDECVANVINALDNKNHFSIVKNTSNKNILPLRFELSKNKPLIERFKVEYDEKFAIYRMLMTFLYTWPGNKLIYAGIEMGMSRSFDYKRGLDWSLLSYPMHDSLKEYIKVLGELYLNTAALNSDKLNIVDDTDVKAYYLNDDKKLYMVVINTSDKVLKDYVVFAPYAASYKVVINSDQINYGGQGILGTNELKTRSFNKKPCLKLDLNKYSAIVLSCKYYNKKTQK